MAKFPQPPSQFTGPAFQFLGQVTKQFMGQPTFSYFTGTTPNGLVQGFAGDVAISLDSTTTARWWINESVKSTIPSFNSWSQMGVGITPQGNTNTFQNTSASTSVLTTTTLVVATAAGGFGDIIVTLPTVASYGTARLLFVRQQRGVSNDTVYVQPFSGEKIAPPFTSNYTMGSTNAAVGIMSGTTQWYVVSQSST